MQIDSRQLTILLAVARAGSLSEAARQLGLSQPGVSAAIAQLERSTGAKLLDRGRHGAMPTKAGELLIRRAEAVEQVLADAKTEVELQARGLAGLLTIAGTPGALMSMVPVALQEMKKRFPNFELRVQEANDSDLIALLRDMKVDLTLSTVGIEAPPADVAEIVVAQDALEALVARDHPLRAEIVSLAELGRLPWVLPAARGTFRRHIDALFMTSGVPLPSNVVLCDSLATTKEIIRQTEYVTVLPRTVVASELASGLLRTIRIRQRLVTRSLGVRRLRTPAPSPVSEAFVEALQAASGPP